MTERIGIIYLCIHQYLKDKSNFGIVSTENLIIELGRLWHIPKEYRKLVVKELEVMDLIEVIDKDTIKINGIKNNFSKTIQAIKQLA